MRPYLFKSNKQQVLLGKMQHPTFKIIFNDKLQERSIHNTLVCKNISAPIDVRHLLHNKNGTA